MDRAVVVGNCQAKVLELMLATNDAFAGRFEFVSFPPVHEIPIESVPDLHRAVADAAVVVLQRIDDGYRDGIGLGTETLARIAERATVVRWPSVFWDGYVPDLFYLRDASGAPVSEPPLDYHDRVILSAYGEGLSAEATCRLLADPAQPSEAPERAERATVELELRERDCDVRVASFIRERFREELLVFTMNHPTNRLLEELGQQVLELLGIPGRVDARRMPGEVLGVTFFPLHANHARALGLTFAAGCEAGRIPFRLRDVEYEAQDAVAKYFDYYAGHDELVRLNLDPSPDAPPRPAPAALAERPSSRRRGLRLRRILRGSRRRPPTRAFLHVPKCAGSSITTALEAAFPPGARAPQCFDDATFGLDADYDALQPAMRAAVAVGEEELAALADYQLVCGHFTLTSLLGVTTAEHIATVLREPRARLLSLYAYWATEEFPHVEPYAPQKHAERPLGEFLAEPEIASAVDNQVCRLVLHGDARIPAAGFIADDDVASLAADAITALEQIGFVGIHELPDELWRGLSRAFGVTLQPVRSNVTADVPRAPRCPPYERSIDARAFGQLARRTQVDARIYRHFARRAPAVADAPGDFEDAAFARQLIAFGSLLARR